MKTGFLTGKTLAVVVYFLSSSSTVLRQDNPVHSYSDLDKESRREVADDLQVKKIN